MKINSASFVIPFFMVCTALSGQAADNERSQDRDELHLVHRLPPFGELQKADKVIGMEIKDRDGAKLGRVKDLAIDLERGRVVEVIAAQGGGLMGAGERLIAVPPAALTFDSLDGRLRLDAAPDKFKNAPIFLMGHWDGDFDINAVTAVYEWYGTKPYFVVESPMSGKTASSQVEPPRHVERATKLAGMTARNPQSEKLGQIDRLIIDLPDARVVEVILSTGVFLGMSHDLNVVPPTAFRFDQAHDKDLILDTTRDTLRKATHFKSREWSRLSDPAYVTEVYHAYHVEPYFGEVDSSVQNVRERMDGVTTPPNQRENKPAEDVAVRIRKEVQRQDGLSPDAQHVKITTADGKVALRGTVDSPEEKKLLGQIAGDVVRPENVDNQLEIKGKPGADSSGDSK